MAENNKYLTLCPHCEKNLPARTFRRHREVFFYSTTGSWEKDLSLVDSSGDESPFIEIDDSIPYPVCSPCNSHSETGSDSDEEQVLMSREIWDEILVEEVDKDILQNPSIPLVNVNSSQHPSYCTLLNCLVVLLAYFWTYFPIPDNALDFLLLALERFFQAASFSNHWFAASALAFPGSIYLFRKEIGLVGDKFTKYVVCPTCCAIYKFEDSYRTVGLRKISKTCSFVRFTYHITGKGVCEMSVALRYYER